MLRPSPLLSLLLLAPVPSSQETFVHWESPHVHPLDVTPDGSRLLAVNTPDNRLEIFDLTGPLPVPMGSVPVGLDPVSVRALSNRYVWVANHVSDTVSVVDLVTGNVVRTLATDDEPADVCFASKPLRAYVSCSQANTVLVFDPFDLDLPPARLAIDGEDPRALATTPARDRVFVAIFESGNGTTSLGGGIVDDNGSFPPNVVNDPAGPHGGVNPPPNDGAGFLPALNPVLPAPPPVALIVRRDAAGAWHDDTGADWTSLVSGPQAPLSGRPVGWTLLDHDVAIIDNATLTTTYADGLMNLDMALAVNPASGEVTVVGTDATNEVRFEPNLSGTFVRAHLARFDPAAPSASTVSDLNPQLDYQSSNVPQATRDLGLADPRGIVWSADGQHGYVSGMGSNNVVEVDAGGARAGAPIEVAEGPTGLVLDEPRGRLYVLAKFAAALSVVDPVAGTEIARVDFHDPSPVAIKVGRRHLYDAHATSGTGIVACASCHVDARMDRLAWDLGDPSGDMKIVDGTQNLGGNVPGLNDGFEDWHPMKGPMLTQTLQDIIGKEPHHWRGDRDGLEEFSGAFVGLMGDDGPPSGADMQEFENFLATIWYPPNPYRDLDNTLSDDVPLEGHYTTGRFAPAGQPLPNGNAVNGQVIYRPPRMLDDLGAACVTCHSRPTGAGTNLTFSGGSFTPFPIGPNGEEHLALVSTDGLTNVTMKIPQLRNLYERTGFNTTQLESTAGFGYLHDGSVDSIERFVSEPIFVVTSDQEIADLTAFMLSFSGLQNPLGSLGNPLELRGVGSQGTHAAVGRQLTLDGAPTIPESDLLAILTAEADQGDIGLVIHGRRGGQLRGWAYLGNGRWQSDRRLERVGTDDLLAGAAPGEELTLTAVPPGSQTRIGIDRDSDGALDGDERVAGTDPADPASRPKVQASLPPQ
jgi:YVTN family beta-propeller protein